MSLKISVIIPSYNMAKFIEETIQSILSQNYHNVECIVMDGGSTDGTLDILRKYEGRIIWQSERDKGQSDAINKGLKLATGDVVAYLDADDVYEKGCFQRVANFFESNHQAKWAYGKCRVINERGSEIRKPVTWFKNFWLGQYSYDKLLVVNFISQPSAFWRKQLVDEIGFFEVDEHHVMDYEYWLRVGAKYSPGFIPDYLARYRVHPRAKTSLNPLRAWREGTRVSQKYTNSRRVIIFRYLASLGIIAAQPVLNFASWIRSKIARRTVK